MVGGRTADEWNQIQMMNKKWRPRDFILLFAPKNEILPSDWLLFSGIGKRISGFQVFYFYYFKVSVMTSDKNVFKEQCIAFKNLTSIFFHLHSFFIRKYIYMKVFTFFYKKPKIVVITPSVS